MHDPSGPDVGLGAVVANTRSKVLEQRANSSESCLISHILALFYLSDDAKHNPLHIERRVFDRQGFGLAAFWPAVADREL